MGKRWPARGLVESDMDVIVDIDGTLADCTHRLHHIQKQPKDWDAFFAGCVDDAPIGPIVELVESLAKAGHRIIFCSGRSDRVRAETKEWLRVNFDYLYPQHLFMRKDGDHRPDNQVKKGLLADMRAAYLSPVMAIEDRAQVVKLWRDEGLICLQVAEGNF